MFVYLNEPFTTWIVNADILCVWLILVCIKRQIHALCDSVAIGAGGVGVGGGVGIPLTAGGFPGHNVFCYLNERETT